MILGGNGGSTCKGKILAQMKPWRVVDFFPSTIVSWKNPKNILCIAFVVSTILETLGTIIGCGLFKFNWKIVKPHAEQ